MIGVESLRIAVRGILANRLRSLLTMLGVMIGVSAVIVLIAVGNGSSQAVRRQLEQLGTNVLTVFQGGGFLGRGGGGSRNGTASRSSALTMDDVEALQKQENAPDLKSVSPVVNTQVTATYQGATYSTSQFVGTNAAYFEANNDEVAAGRLFTDADYESRSRVVLLGETTAESLFGSAALAVGSKILLNGVRFEVIGVLAPKGSTGPFNQDDVAIAPLTAVEDTLTGQNSTLSSIVTQATSSDATDAAQAEIISTLLSTHDVTNVAAADFSVFNQASLLAASSASNRVFTVLLGAVAGISLLVGGIGVMNIMLVTVTERTREIGIRMAVGARRSHIVSQFLVEAVLLAMIGGLVGVVGGLVGSRFQIVGVQPIVAPYSVFLAFGVAVLVGIFFGSYPANRAASLRPIEALRYE